MNKNLRVNEEPFIKKPNLKNKHYINKESM